MAEINDGDVIPITSVDIKRYTPVNKVRGDSKTLVRVNGNLSPFIAGTEAQLTAEGIIGTDSAFEILASSRVAYEPLTFSIREHDKAPVFAYYLNYTFNIIFEYKVSTSPFAVVNQGDLVEFEGYVLATAGLNNLTISGYTDNIPGGTFDIGTISMGYNIGTMTVGGVTSITSINRVSASISGSIGNMTLAGLGTTKWSGSFTYVNGVAPFTPLSGASSATPVGRIVISSDLTVGGKVTPALIASIPIPSVKHPP